MDTSRLDLLEERIRKAAALIQSLREEARAAEERIAAKDEEIQDLRTRIDSPPSREMAEEVERLRRERQDVLARVTKMLSLLDADGQPAQKSLLAAVDGGE